jgi:5'(3')-deoxyribonucleotidase
MIERALLDMDGVLVDFNAGISEYYGVPLPDYPFNPDKQTVQQSWNIEHHFGRTPAQLWDPLGFAFWAGLKPLPWFTEVVGLLEDHFGEENICLLTSPIKTEGAIDGKIDWIRRHLPQYRRRFLVGPCKEFCAGPRHALIDDHSVNIEKFRDAGGRTFLFPAPWNRRFKEHPVPALKEWLGALSTLAKSCP